MTSQALTGRLLVATPVLGDPNFDRTVVLVLAHGEEGAVGVVLNRPSTTEVAGPLPEWDAFAARPPVVFVGGPVAPGAVIGLARVRPDAGADGWAPLVGGVGTLDLSRELEDVAPAIEEVRLFAGYAGWGEGQLEAEIDAAAWWVVDAEPEDVLSPEPATLWARVLRRQGGRLAMYAAFPADPSVN